MLSHGLTSYCIFSKMKSDISKSNKLIKLGYIAWSLQLSTVSNHKKEYYTTMKFNIILKKVLIVEIGCDVAKQYTQNKVLIVN